MCSGANKSITKPFENPKKKRKKNGICTVKGNELDVGGKKVHFNLGIK